MRKNWIKEFLSITLITIILFALIETSARLFYKNREYDLENFVTSRPLAFEDDENFKEVVKWFDGSCSYPTVVTTNDIVTFNEDFDCGGIQYKNSKRVTLPHIDEWTKTIHVFGGSTIWGTGAIDSETIPSHIQKGLIANKIRVINYGFSSLVSFQENKLLKKHLDDIEKGDLIIYYDGGNDFWNGVMMGNKDGTIIGFNRKNNFDIYIFIIRNWLSQNLRVYKVLSDLRHGRNKETTCETNNQQANSRIQASALNYASNINDAQSLAYSRGANFIHFYQPTLFDIEKPTDYERMLYKQNPCFQDASDYKKIYNKIFLTASSNSIDLTQLFNNKNFFFDYIHVSGKGNKLAADKILQYIEK